MGTDCIESCKSNYHTIMTMMAPSLKNVNSQAKIVEHYRFLELDGNQYK